MLQYSFTTKKKKRKEKKNPSAKDQGQKKKVGFQRIFKNILTVLQFFILKMKKKYTSYD